MHFPRLFAIPAIIVSLGAGVAYANPAADVEARHQYFKSLAAEMKVLGGLRSSFDADKAKAAAATLGPLLDKDFSTLFVAGTSSADVKGSDAKPVIWQDGAAFTARHAAFETAGRTLVAAAEAGDATAYGAAFTQFGGTCKACHDAFREK